MEADERHPIRMAIGAVDHLPSGIVVSEVGQVDPGHRPDAATRLRQTEQHEALRRMEAEEFRDGGDHLLGTGEADRGEIGGACWQWVGSRHTDDGAIVARPSQGARFRLWMEFDQVEELALGHLSNGNLVGAFC